MVSELIYQKKVCKLIYLNNIIFLHKYFIFASISACLVWKTLWQWNPKQRLFSAALAAHFRFSMTPVKWSYYLIFFYILHFLPSWTCWEPLKGTWGVLLVPENSADCRAEKGGVCFYSVPKITAYRMIDFSELFVPLAHCSSLHSMSLLAALEGGRHR